MEPLELRLGKVCSIPTTHPLFKKIYARFRILDPERIHNPEFVAGHWDGNYSFLSAKGTFAIGLSRDVVNFATKLGCECKVNIPDRLKMIPALKFHKSLHNNGFIAGDGSEAKLYDYQLEALQAMEKRFFGAIVLPTSAGKTEIMADYAKSHPKARILYLSARSALMQQTARRFEAYLEEPVSKIGGGFRIRGAGERVVCGVTNSIHNMLTHKQLDKLRFDVIFIDECHRATSSMIQEIVEFFHWSRLFGFTGSYPSRERNLVKHWIVRSVVGPPIYRKSELEFNKTAQNMPDIRVVFMENNVAVSPYTSGQHIYVALKADGTRNDLMAYIANHCGHGVLVVVNHSDHGRLLESMFKRRGVDALFVDSKRGKGIFTDALQNLDSGQLNVLISTPIIDEGISINNITNLIYAAGHRSEISLIQRVGRGKRKKTRGKNRLTVWDFHDHGHRRTRKNSMIRESIYREITDNVITRATHDTILHVLNGAD